MVSALVADDGLGAASNEEKKLAEPEAHSSSRGKKAGIVVGNSVVADGHIRLPPCQLPSNANRWSGASIKCVVEKLVKTAQPLNYYSCYARGRGCHPEGL